MAVEVGGQLHKIEGDHVNLNSTNASVGKANCISDLISVD